MKYYLKHFVWLLLGVLLLYSASCEFQKGSSPSEADLAVDPDQPAAALTIGWYLPLSYLQKIVGPDFLPTIAKDDTMGVMKLVIFSGDNYLQNGLDKGSFNSAILLIEVEENKLSLKNNPPKANHTYVCPVTVVSESIPLATAFHENGFVNEKSKVTLDIRESGDRINVDARIRSGENILTAKCFFEESPADGTSDIVVFNQTPPVYSFFYGTETYSRYKNGKGRIDSEGTTLLSTLGIQFIPYFFVLDREYSWAYNFEK